MKFVELYNRFSLQRVSLKFLTLDKMGYDFDEMAIIKMPIYQDEIIKESGWLPCYIFLAYRTVRLLLIITVHSCENDPS